MLGETEEVWGRGWEGQINTGNDQSAKKSAEIVINTALSSST